MAHLITHDLYDDLPIENGDLLIYDELFIKYPKKNLTCCRCPLPSPLLLMPLRATSHSKSWFARFNRSVARCQEVALIPNCLVNIGQTMFQFIGFIDFSQKDWDFTAICSFNHFWSCYNQSIHTWWWSNRSFFAATSLKIHHPATPELHVDTEADFAHQRPWSIPWPTKASGRSSGVWIFRSFSSKPSTKYQRNVDVHRFSSKLCFLQLPLSFYGPSGLGPPVGFPGCNTGSAAAGSWPRGLEPGVPKGAAAPAVMMIFNHGGFNAIYMRFIWDLYGIYMGFNGI